MLAQGTSACDGESFLLDQIRTMLVQENTCYSFRHDYFSCCPESDDESMINDHWRRKVAMWSFEVVDHLGVDRDVVSISINCLDRFVGIKTLSSGTLMNKRNFQLASIASLYIALKVHGESDEYSGKQKKFDTRFFVSACRGTFSMEEIADMERQVLAALNWRINPPTAVSLVALMLDLFPSQHNSQVDVTSLTEMARYVTELSVCSSASLFRFKQSTVAYAAILIAMEALDEEDVKTGTIQADYLQILTRATSMTPNHPNVQEARAMLVDICPNMTHQWHPEGKPSHLPGSGGKVSPIQVCCDKLGVE